MVCHWFAGRDGTPQGQYGPMRDDLPPLPPFNAPPNPYFHYIRDNIRGLAP